MKWRQLRFPLIVAACAVAVLAVGPACTPAPPVPPSSSNITVTQNNLPYSWFCLPSFFALRHSITSTPTQFVLTIKATVRPCNTVNAHAVIYAMPGPYGNAWPQTLAEKKSFIINRAGTTTVVFNKGCDPVQFDVVTGATPPTIAPWGPWHGPLLFPFTLETSQQYWPGPNCNPGGECDDYTPSQVAVSPASVNAGGQFTISGTGVPGDTVSATLDVNPVVALGSSPVDQNGQFSILATIPAGTPPGDYDIVVASENCPTSTTVTITVGGALLQVENVGVDLPGGPSDTQTPLRFSAGIGALLIGLFALTRLTGRRVRSRSAK
jgi:hypothetical protein